MPKVDSINKQRRLRNTSNKPQSFTNTMSPLQPRESNFGMETPMRTTEQIHECMSEASLDESPANVQHHYHISLNIGSVNNYQMNNQGQPQQQQ